MPHLTEERLNVNEKDALLFYKSNLPSDQLQQSSLHIADILKQGFNATKESKTLKNVVFEPL